MRTRTVLGRSNDVFAISTALDHVSRPAWAGAYSDMEAFVCSQITTFGHRINLKL
jgi:hypothetical protein